MLNTEDKEILEREEEVAREFAFKLGSGDVGDLVRSFEETAEEVECFSF